MLYHGKLIILNTYVKGATNLNTLTAWQPVTPSTYADGNYPLCCSYLAIVPFAAIRLVASRMFADKWCRLILATYITPCLPSREVAKLG